MFKELGGFTTNKLDFKFKRVAGEWFSEHTCGFN